MKFSVMIRNLFYNSEERVAEYRSMRQRLEELDASAVEFADKLALQKSIMDGVNSLPVEKRGAAIKQFAHFMREQNKQVAAAVNERARIVKSMEKYRRDSEISSRCADIDSLYRAKEMYHRGRLNKAIYFNIVKSVTGQPVKYADVLAQDRGTGKFLILHRVENFNPTGKVCLPGGHVDEGEDFFDAAVRELKEETNLDPIKDSQVVDLGEYRSKDAWIHYFLIQVDGSQPVTVDSSEHCFSEWVYMQDFVMQPFIFDQGLIAMKKYAESNSMWTENVEKVYSAYKEGRLTQEVFLAVAAKMFKKAVDCDGAAPLMPESMDGAARVIFAVRDANMDIEKLMKGISGAEEFTVNGSRVKLVKPLLIRNVSYANDPSDNFLTQLEIAYDGNEDDMRKVLENFAHSLMFGGSIKVETPEEEFMAANERGSDYIGDPIFCTTVNSI